MKTVRTVRVEEFGGPEKMSVITVELPPRRPAVTISPCR